MLTIGGNSHADEKKEKSAAPDGGLRRVAGTGSLRPAGPVAGADAGGNSEVRLELGCGKGRFTAGTAAAEPDVLLIAVEKVPDAMVVAMERCRDGG